MSKEKADRNKRLYAYHQKRPDWSIAAVARVFHMSRARAWLIIQQEKRKGEQTDGTGEECAPPG